MSLIGKWMAYKAWTPAMFSKKAGVTLPTVTRLMKPDVRHREETIRKYAPLFGLTFEEFLAGPPIMSAEEQNSKYLQVRGRQIQEVLGENTKTSTERGNGEKESEMSEKELLGEVVKVAAQLDGFHLTKLLGQAEMMLDEMKAEKNIAQVS